MGGAAALELEDMAFTQYREPGILMWRDFGMQVFLSFARNKGERGPEGDSLRKACERERKTPETRISTPEPLPLPLTLDLLTLPKEGIRHVAWGGVSRLAIDHLLHATFSTPTELRIPGRGDPLFRILFAQLADPVAVCCM